MKKLIPLLILFFLFTFSQKAQAMTEISGDLQVTYDNPLFPPSVIWSPGLSLTKSFVVRNLGTTIHPVSVKAINISQTDNAGQVYWLKISEGGITIYGANNSKTMKDFWDDGQIGLSNLAGGTAITYEITIAMKNSAGNLYQGSQAKFDLIIGFAGTVSQVTVSGGTTLATASPTPTSAPTLTPTPISGVVVNPTSGVVLGKTGQTGATTVVDGTNIPNPPEGKVAGAKTPIVSWPIIALGGVGVIGGAAALYLFLRKG